MAVVGSPIIEFGALTFSETGTDDACIQSVSYEKKNDELEYRCGGNYITLPGAAKTVLTLSLAIAATDVALLAVLEAKTIQTDFAYQPFGATTGNIQHTSNASVSFGYSESEASNGIVLVDAVIAVHNPVTAAIPV